MCDAVRCITLQQFDGVSVTCIMHWHAALMIDVASIAMRLKAAAIKMLPCFSVLQRMSNVQMMINPFWHPCAEI